MGLHPQVVGEDGFSVISNGLPIRAHSIRRLKGEDLLRVDGELPMILENKQNVPRNTLPETNVTMENQPFEDVFPIENSDFLLSFLFWGV